MSIARHFLVPFALALLTPQLAHATEKTYRVGHFADDFYATVTVDESEPDQVLRTGRITVHDAASGKRLLELDSDALAFDVENGEIAPNVLELPYGRQSVLIYDDFDFDGKPDLALMDGQNSCYGGPSFQIYLRAAHGFERSEAFTRLAQDYCGMFQVDHAKHRISTLAKSGCCWHQFETYDVVAHTPHLLDSLVERLATFSPAYVALERPGQPAEYSLAAPADSGAEPLLSFELQGSPGRRVELFVVGGQLDYALTVGPSRRVELSYQLDVVGQRRGVDREVLPAFHFDSARHELGFRNGDYRYVVSDAAGRLGVTVKHAGRTQFIAGNANARRGGLNGLQQRALSNVVID